MIDKEIIIEFLEDCADSICDILSLIFYGVVFVLCVVTVPIWFIPYLIYKRNHKSDTKENDE